MYSNSLHDQPAGAEASAPRRTNPGARAFSLSSVSLALSFSLSLSPSLLSLFLFLFLFLFSSPLLSSSSLFTLLHAPPTQIPRPIHSHKMAGCTGPQPATDRLHGPTQPGARHAEQASEPPPSRPRHLTEEQRHSPHPRGAGTLSGNTGPPELRRRRSSPAQPEPSPARAELSPNATPVVAPAAARTSP